MIVSAPRRLHLLSATLAVLPLLIIGAGSVAARDPGRGQADAAAQAVAYHLTLVGGLAQPSAVEGQVSGMLDSQGVLTATLTTTDGLTTTVRGTLAPTGGVTLTMQWRGTGWTLSGRMAASGRGSGSITMAAASGSAGAWLLAPELVSRTFSLDAHIGTGRYRGQDLGGRLVIALEQGGAGRFDGTLTEDEGTTLAVRGLLVFGNMQIIIAGPGHGRLMGDAAMTQSRTVLGDPYTLYKGTFAGPGTGDRGTWTAAQEG